ncbi:hypothetical protein I3760_03G059200 [Carya illinoinensis]|uniref:Uncharacterized protein n=1 Tax=Carya illinoinensis TaxID=32201 RepID=A0A8T1QXM6_CARIL|nr:uncharacterized protein LOC122305619 [Carya illinoinensis]KAG2715059.1 hypothetical protein I3760_03G059200 [Carya illinoinensis]KAG6659868.1 hypothetical protein CIPAW_03G066100 [Carya illinoinensis]KAG6720442.1 hypothetical protein I3842_03G061600 [Carya illinoinensis]
MGNYVSCTLAGAPGGKHSRATKVIFPGGEIRQFREPIKAAELMLEIPNFFLVNSSSLHIGRRFSALNADEDLEMANVYVMFPMKRLRSVVSAADMGVLFLTANSMAKNSVSGGKVRFFLESGNAPNMVEGRTTDERMENEAAHHVEVPKLNLDDIEEFSTPEFMHRLSMCRSKKPVLDTIAEDQPIYSS